MAEKTKYLLPVPVESVNGTQYWEVEATSPAGAVLVSVTNEPGPWDEELPAMIEELRAATKRCQDAVKAYDQAKREEAIQKRQSNLEAARAAFSKG